MMFDGKAFGEEVVGIMQDYVERQLAPLRAENENLKARVAELESRPAPEKGEKGEPGEAGKDGRDGTDGKDGRGVKDLLIDREGQMVATMDDGEMKSLGPVIGKDGEPGKDGRDGLGFDDMDACVLDDDRTIELSFRRGDDEKAFTFKWPTMIYRGVFKEGERYEAGDAVTWGGSLWHCDKATAGKPDCGDWTLCTKRGRDGKDANNG